MDNIGTFIVEPNRVTEAMCKNGEPLTVLTDIFVNCDLLISGQVTILPQLVIDVQGLSLLPGGTAALTAVSHPADIGTITWTSSNPDVAKVENGTVTAVSEGSADITAALYGGTAKATCRVLVSGGTLKLGDTEIKSGKYYSVSQENTLEEADAAPESGGYAYYTYDGEGNGTLTLRDFSADYDGGSLGAIRGSLPKLTIEQKGENTLNVHNDGDVVIGGSGSITAESGISADCGGLTVSSGTVTANRIAVSYGDFTISGGTVESGALSADGSITVTGGEANTDSVSCHSVTVTGGTLTAKNRGVEYVVKAHEVTVSGGTLTASLTEGTGVGAAVKAHRITVSDGTLNALAENCRDSEGIICDELIVTGGVLNAVIKNDGATSDGYYTIRVMNNAFISGGTVNGSVTGVGEHTGYAISVYSLSGQLVISGGTVNLTASENSGDSPIAFSGQLVISGGTVNLTAIDDNGAGCIGIDNYFNSLNSDNNGYVIPVFSGGSITVRAAELLGWGESPILKDGMTLISKTDNEDGTFTFVYEKVSSGDDTDTSPSRRGGGSSSTTTTTTKNDDGSTTKTTTNKRTGTTTETTTYPDGSTTKVETKKDGTVTTTEKDKDGNTTTTVENPDGSSTSTEKNKDGSETVVEKDTEGTTTTTEKDSEGNKTVTTEKADGTTTTEETKKDGTTVKTETTASGETKAEVEANGETEVVIPVPDTEKVQMVVITDEDGNNTYITEIETTDNGVAVTTSGNASVSVKSGEKKEFVDVHPVNHWSEKSVDFVHILGLMNGTSATHFSPDVHLTRAMLVTVLYRAEGEPEIANDESFADVEGGSYYEKAVAWAKANGIVNGTSATTFEPNTNITREQIAAIMHRYATFKGYDVSVGENTNILSYDDFNSISEYAIGSMQWAVGSGLIKGKSESTLSPLDNATRAEIAAILHRYIEANK